MNPMKNVILIALFATLLFACTNDPKLTQQEEKIVDSTLNSDQKSMDSLESAIMAQMAAIEVDTNDIDSLE